MKSIPTNSEIDQLRKPVNTIALVPQSHKITVLARKAYNVMLSIAQTQGLEREVHSASMGEIIAGLDYGSNDTEIIKKYLRAMSSTVVEWNSPKTGEAESWTVCNLLSYAHLSKRGGQVRVDWAYSPALRKEMIEPSVFVRLPISILSQMHTHAGIALYEITSRYKAIGRTSRQPWRWWLPVLTGHPNSEKLAKTEYRFFKRDSIRTAIAEINAITDIEVELIEYKNGRSVEDLQFLVKQKSQPAQQPKTYPKPLDLSLIRTASELGIETGKAEELLAHHGEDALRDALKSLQGRVSSSFPGPVRNPYRYIKSILLGEQSLQTVEQTAPMQPPAVTEMLISQNHLSPPASVGDDWIKKQRAKVENMLVCMPDQNIEELEKQFLGHLIATNKHPSIIQRMKKSGWTHSLVKHLMIEYCADSILGQDWRSSIAATSSDLSLVAQ